MKKQITFNQLKRLVKEARFGDKLRSLDDPAFTDTQDQYNVRKLRNQMLKDMNTVESNEDLLEAVQLLLKMGKILENRVLSKGDDSVNEPETWYDAMPDGPMPGIDNSDGFYTDLYVVDTMKTGLIRFSCDDGKWGFDKGDSCILDDTTPDALVEYACKELDQEHLEDVAEAIHRMAVELDGVLDKVDGIYNEFVKMPGIKMTEGRFAGKIKALDKVGEGRFAKQLASLDAMMECGDEPVKLNEGTKVTLTLKQLKKLVKEATMKPEIEKIKAQLEHESLLSDFDEDGETVPPSIRIRGNVFKVYATFNDACVDEPGNTAWDNVANSARRAAERLWEYQQKYGKQGIQFVLLCDAQGPGGYFDFSNLKMSKVTSKSYIDVWVRTNAPEDDEDDEESYD